MTRLARRLGLTSAIMITVGSVIGSGIFLKPLDIAKNLPDPAMIYVFWIAIGLVCLCGALAYAELGAMLPEAGGQYTFLREAWGPLPAFLFGWCYFLVINTGTMSALAIAFVDSLMIALDMGLSTAARLTLAAMMILLLAIINHLGVRWGALLQNVTTFAKIGSLVVLVVAGYTMGTPATDMPTPVAAHTGVAATVTACVAIFWAYEGWHQLPFSAAELRRPDRDLPLGLILGVLILIGIYVLVNSVYLHLVPIDEMRTFAGGEEARIPALAVERTFGGTGGRVLAAMICLSVFGAANPNMLSSSRAFYAMAEDGLAPAKLTAVHSAYRTPTVSIWTQAVWAIVLILVMQGFKELTEFVVFAALIFYALTVAAVWVLRRRWPDRERPHRCIGYPVTPAIFVLAVLFVDSQMLMQPRERLNALYGLGILAAGIPVYFLFVRRRESRPDKDQP